MRIASGLDLMRNSLDHLLRLFLENRMEVFEVSKSESWHEILPLLLGDNINIQCAENEYHTNLVCFAFSKKEAHAEDPGYALSKWCRFLKIIAVVDQYIRESPGLQYSDSLHVEDVEVADQTIIRYLIYPVPEGIGGTATKKVEEVTHEK